jgi:hypothetical protein
MKFISELSDWEDTFLTEYEKAQAHYGNVEALLPKRLAKKRLEGRRVMMELMNPRV